MKKVHPRQNPGYTSMLQPVRQVKVKVKVKVNVDFYSASSYTALYCEVQCREELGRQ